MSSMNPENIIKICYEKLPGTDIVEAWGEKGIFYNPDKRLARGVYVMTVKEKDGNNDRGSQLSRGGVFRVNTGIRKSTFKELFGEIPVRPEAGGIVKMNYDFTARNQIIPHPVYAWMGWICVLNPTENIFDKFMEYIEESYKLAKEKYKKRIRQME